MTNRSYSLSSFYCISNPELHHKILIYDDHFNLFILNCKLNIFNFKAEILQELNPRFFKRICPEAIFRTGEMFRKTFLSLSPPERLTLPDNFFIRGVNKLTLQVKRGSIFPKYFLIYLNGSKEIT